MHMVLCLAAGASSTSVGGVHLRHGLLYCCLLLGISQQELQDACEEEERQQAGQQGQEQGKQHEDGEQQERAQLQFQVGRRQQPLLHSCEAICVDRWKVQMAQTASLVPADVDAPGCEGDLQQLDALGFPQQAGSHLTAAVLPCRRLSGCCMPAWRHRPATMVRPRLSQVHGLACSSAVAGGTTLCEVAVGMMDEVQLGVFMVPGSCQCGSHVTAGLDWSSTQLTERP
jgi:hypothetical protein